MKRLNAIRRWALASLLLAPVIPVVAADDPALRVKLEDPKSADKYRVGLSYRMGFNITAQFRNVGNVGTGPGRGPGPATGGGIDRFYDDGYNRVDTSGNKDGLTWFWGYQNASQVPGNDTLVMHSTSVTPLESKTIDSDPQHGFELTFNREFGRFEKHDCRWGLEAALGWMDIDIRDNRPLTGGVRSIADAYNLGGVTPPPPPYNGTAQGPGPLIEDSPSRTLTTAANGALVTGMRHFEADLFTFRLGPYLEIPIDDQWSLSFSLGAAVGVLNGDLAFRQQVSTGGTPRWQTGSGSETDLLVGGFVSGTIRCAINDQWSVFAGGQYMGLTEYHAKARGQEIELDLARAAFFTLGVAYSF